MSRALPLAVTLTAAALLACAHQSAQERRGAEIHHDLGVEALRAGRWPDALREFDDALHRNEAFPEAHLGRGLVMEFGFGKVEEAEKEYRRALALRPGYSEAHNDLGQLLARTGRHAAALVEFDAALADLLYREPYVARCNKGTALWNMGRKDEGVEELQACLAKAPKYCDGRRELGRLLLRDGRTREAVEQLSAYAEACDLRPDAHQQLGIARMKAGDMAGAKASFERCRELGGSTPVGAECERSLSLFE